MGVSVKGSGSGGLSSSDVTASSAQVLAGYTALTTDSNDEAKQGTISTLAADTFYPSTTDQTVAAGQYLGGAQTFKAVTTANISAENIKAGVSIAVGDAADPDRILGITGTFTNDATASADDILSGKTAYTSTGKITGTITEYAGALKNISINLDQFSLDPAITNFVVIDSAEINIYPYAEDQTYTGSEVDTNIVNNIPELMTISGTTSATAIGTYTCTVTLATGYTFKDSGLTTRSLSWDIVSA